MGILGFLSVGNFKLCGYFYSEITTEVLLHPFDLTLPTRIDYEL